MLNIHPKWEISLQYECMSRMELLCQCLLSVLFFMPALPFSPQISTLRRQGRTLFSTVPETAEKEAHSLFVQEVKLIHTWT